MIATAKNLNPFAHWKPLRYHALQVAYERSTARFNVVPAGRRSGKTERAKRRLVKRALSACEHADPWFVAGAPTYNQAKRIWWRDLKHLVPSDWVAKITESDLTIHLINGADIQVVGFDVPERIEGRSLDGVVLDEYGNMKEKVWLEHVRPALSDRRGWADFIGVPEGRNHYWRLYKRALAEQNNPNSEWRAFHWKSAEILPADEIASARRDLDALVFAQEYEASFVTFTGRAYYNFSSERHATRTLSYDRTLPLILCFDFNVSPGVCAYVQELSLGTCVIGEVWIKDNSNTEAVCNKIIADWQGKHKRPIHVYGDPSGGARKTSAKEGETDWVIVKRMLNRAFPNQVHMKVKRAHPTERSRINAVNSRLLNADGQARLYVDPNKAPHTVEDFEGVRIKEGSAGSIDKGGKGMEMLSHLTDAIGYYVESRFPVRSGPSWKEEQLV